MIFSGANLEGVTLKSNLSLASIGDIIFEYDDSFLVAKNSSDEVEEWGCIASNYGIGAIKPNISTTNKLKTFSDGLGINGTGSGATTCLYNFDRLIANVVFSNIFLTNTPYVIFSVGKKMNNGDGSSNAVLSFINLRNAANTANLMYARTLQRQNTMSAFKVSTVNGGSLITDNTRMLMAHVYYGAGTDNYKFIANNNSSIATVSNDSDSNGSTATVISVVNHVNSLWSFRLQKLLAYSLAGKTKSEIDLFVSTVIALIKQDPKYSSL